MKKHYYWTQNRHGTEHEITLYTPEDRPMLCVAFWNSEHDNDLVAEMGEQLKADVELIVDALNSKAVNTSSMTTRNAIRAKRAQAALQSYVEAKGEVFENSGSEIADLMADLLHLTVRIDQGDDPVESTLRLARIHFDAEHNNPEEEAA